MGWYIQALRAYATFTGRARRKEYWYFVLFSVLIMIVIAVVEDVLGLTRGEDGGVLARIYELAVMVPIVAVGVRRMHDTDHTGWWLIVPIVNFVFACMDGDPVPNRFGDDPKASERLPVTPSASSLH